MKNSMWMMRRIFLMSPLGLLGQGGIETFRKEHVLGTSLELQVDGGGGAEAFAACLDEVERLRGILSTYDEGSAISRWMRRGETGPVPAELAELLDLYSDWGKRSGGALRSVINGRRDVNALGKSLIVERAIAAVAGKALLNIGGDIAVRGGRWRVRVCDPQRWHENAASLTEVELCEGAVTTSGNYERGGHIAGGRGVAGATVLAKDAVTANALSTALCVMSEAAGRKLVEQTLGAESLVVEADGRVWRSSGFGGFEKAVVLRHAAAAIWPKGQVVTVTLTLKAVEGYRVRRPYVAVWAENMSGKVVRNISVWAGKRRWWPDLFEWWKKTGSAGAGATVTRATRGPGRYQLMWDGLDDAGRPVPAGKYRVVVESNRENGSYAKESGVIECGVTPAKVMLKENGEFEAVELNYGTGGVAA